MNGLENRQSSGFKKQTDVYQTNPLGVSRKQFDKFVRHNKGVPRKIIFQELDLGLEEWVEREENKGD